MYGPSAAQDKKTWPVEQGSLKWKFECISFLSE